MSDHLSRHTLYQQVADALAERIAQGVWKPGSNIPNEVELARQMGVSAGTMRKALDRLESNNLIVRRQGRGTFIRDQADCNYRYELLRDHEGAPLNFGRELLSQMMGSADEAEREKLKISSSDKVLRTTRLRRRAGQPYFYETAVLATKRFPRFDEADAGNYFISALAQMHGVILGEAVEDLRLCSAAREITAALDLAPDSALVRLDRVVNALSGEPVEWRTAYCALNNERYVVVME
jgi:GntR family transcriptional regulator